VFSVVVADGSCLENLKNKVRLTVRDVKGKKRDGEGRRGMEKEGENTGNGPMTLCQIKLIRA